MLGAQQINRKAGPKTPKTDDRGSKTGFAEKKDTYGVTHEEEALEEA